ncbi:hypothetical protein PR048_003968 [Dryococelus australis]|uniref:Uncharacterized protein n=1 Tax=Dryococelus australis TaxID=614101 RepID=A0ABQ9I481_9NEOP|nr:hypothetical protein PR048_003968 [Dryococelus australis]
MLHHTPGCKQRNATPYTRLFRTCATTETACPPVGSVASNPGVNTPLIADTSAASVTSTEGRQRNDSRLYGNDKEVCMSGMVLCSGSVWNSGITAFIATGTLAFCRRGSQGEMPGLGQETQSTAIRNHSRRMLGWVPNKGHGRILPQSFFPVQTCAVYNDFAIDETLSHLPTYLPKCSGDVRNLPIWSSFYKGFIATRIKFPFATKHTAQNCPVLFSLRVSDCEEGQLSRARHGGVGTAGAAQHSSWLTCRTTDTAHEHIQMTRRSLIGELRPDFLQAVAPLYPEILCALPTAPLTPYSRPRTHIHAPRTRKEEGEGGCTPSPALTFKKEGYRVEPLGSYAVAGHPFNLQWEWSSTGMKGRGKREIPEKTCQLAASFGTVPTCENPGVTRPGVEPGSPRWLGEGGEQSNHSATTAPQHVKGNFLFRVARGHGGVVDRLLTSCLGEPDSIPCGLAPEFSHVDILPDDATGRRVFSGISRFSRRFIPMLLHSHLIYLYRLSRPQC